LEVLKFIFVLYSRSFLNCYCKILCSNNVMFLKETFPTSILKVFCNTLTFKVVKELNQGGSCLVVECVCNTWLFKYTLFWILPAYSCCVSHGYVNIYLRTRSKYYKLVSEIVVYPLFGTQNCSVLHWSFNCIKIANTFISVLLLIISVFKYIFM
jgi:hypothetical protein